MSSSNLTIAMLATVSVGPDLLKQAILDTALTVAEHDAAIRVARMARLAGYYSRQMAQVTDWACTCEPGTLALDPYAMRLECPGTVDCRLEGCTCPQHLYQSWQGVLWTDQGSDKKAVRGLVAKEHLADEIRGQVDSTGRMACLLSDATRSVRPNATWTDAPGERPMVRLARSLGLNVKASTASDEVLPPALPPVPQVTHSCGPKRSGWVTDSPHGLGFELAPAETWAAYAARNGRHCPGCQADRLDVVLPDTPTPVASWGGLQADRVASLGRYPAMGSPGARRVS